MADNKTGSWLGWSYKKSWKNSARVKITATIAIVCIGDFEFICKNTKYSHSNIHYFRIILRFAVWLNSRGDLQWNLDKFAVKTELICPANKTRFARSYSLSRSEGEYFRVMVWKKRKATFMVAFCFWVARTGIPDRKPPINHLGASFVGINFSSLFAPQTKLASLVRTGSLKQKNHP
jgi:hypothetical protein